MRELLAAIEAGGRELVVDLSGASFVDSTFLGVLLGARKRLAGRGEVTIVCGNRSLAKIFAITGLDHVFAIHPTLDSVQYPEAEPAGGGS